MAFTYKKLDHLSQGGRLNARALKVEGMLTPLKILLGDAHPRLMEIEARLPNKTLGIWRHGENYHEAFSTLRRLSTYNWFVFSDLLKEAQIDPSMPADLPAWERLASSPNGKGEWMRTHVSSPDKAPKGWTTLGFDDSQWARPTDKTRWPEGGYNLVRIPFEFDKANYKAKALRIAVDNTAAFSEGAEIYLNGEKILSTVSGIKNESVYLIKDVAKLLRPGRNVLSYVTANNDGRGFVQQITLQGDLRQLSTFAWTPMPGRYAEFRDLVAQRRLPTAYYQASEDTRTVKECMQVFKADPFFMPEAFYALQRFNTLLPAFAGKADHIDALLKSPNWGARWVGLRMISDAKNPMDEKLLSRLSKEEQANVKAQVAVDRPLTEPLIPHVIALLDDPHHQVRCQAATAVGLYGAAAKESIPALIRLVGDVEGQNWFIRSQAWDALARMPLEETTKHAVARMGLKDPSSTVRRAVLNSTLESSDGAQRAIAIQTYKEAMIHQIFDAPHGMWTKSTRREMAEMAIKELSKDDLRPYLPQFLASLARPRGDQLQGRQHGYTCPFRRRGAATVGSARSRQERDRS